MAFDHIVIGAGSAGCAVAARLADAGRRVQEAGGQDRGKWLRIPRGVGKILNNPAYVWQFKTEPEAGAGNRSLFWYYFSPSVRPATNHRCIVSTTATGGSSASTCGRCWSRPIPAWTPS